MDSYTSIIDDLMNHINVLKELGQRTVEIEPQVVRDLTAPIVAAVSPKNAAVAQSKVQRAEGRERLSKSVLQCEKPLDAKARVQELEEIAGQVRHCTECALCQSRVKALPGQGNPNSPDIMFIGPAPDADDEQAGETFSGPAGELMTQMIKAMGYDRKEVFLTNICKCRPESDRAPLLDEMQACSAFLEEQIRIIRPKTIVVMGEHAIKGLFLKQSGATAPQGRWTQYHGIPVMPTFHPKYILRFHNDAQGQQKRLKSSVWSALQAVMRQTGKV